MSDLKNKLEEIHKLANTLPDKIAFKPQGRMQSPPGSTTPTGDTGGAAPPSGASGGRFTHRTQPGQRGAAPTGGKGTVNTSPAIKKMQESMQALAQTISSTINYDALLKGMNQPQTADKKKWT